MTQEYLIDSDTLDSHVDTLDDTPRFEYFSDVAWSDDEPASLVAPDGVTMVGRRDVALVEVFTSREQRARTSQAYFRSAVGARLRVVAASETADERAARLRLIQHDPDTGLHAHTLLERPHGLAVTRISTTLTNDGVEPVRVTAVSSATIGVGHTERVDDLLFGSAASEWLAENRWRERPLTDELPSLNLAFHAQDGRGHATITSHGAWSSGEHLPVGYIVNAASHAAVAWQIEGSAGWHMDLSSARDGIVLSLLGPTDLEHHFNRLLAPGESFETVPVALAVSREGRDGVIAELTQYRRWLRSAQAEPLPVVYNDFMNTLMGQPSTEALLPLIDEAAAAGAEVFCIDAGWFADPAIGDWWDTVGEWVEAPSRFTGGLQPIVDRILAHGMRAGIWLEPEVVGRTSDIARHLPPEAFFSRFGDRVMEHDRYHLDLRHPAARDHLDDAVRRLVDDYGFTYFKFDYNINPGVGTDTGNRAPADGLLEHSRALRDWLIDVQMRHPGVLIENCSSGAMRADYSLLSVTHLQSTSDQQDFMRYAPIAASAPAHIAPEQCGNWAYPSSEMNAEQLAFTLVSGLSGRFYLSGFLERLGNGQRALVHEAVRLHKELRDRLRTVTPFWPLGLPRWDDAIVCLGLRDSTGTILFLWDRDERPHSFHLPTSGSSPQQIFPDAAARWNVSEKDGGLHVQTTHGVSARIIKLQP